MQAQLSVAWYMVVKCLYLQNPFSFMAKIKDFFSKQVWFLLFCYVYSKSMLSSLKPLWINVVIKLKRHIYHNPKMSEHFDCFIFVRNVKYWFRQLQLGPMHELKLRWTGSKCFVPIQNMIKQRKDTGCLPHTKKHKQ